MALDARTANKAGYELGDRVDVVLLDGKQSFTLVAIIGFGETDSLLGATLAGFDLPTAQRVLGKDGVVDEVDVLAVDGVTAEQLRDRIADALPAGVEALTGDQVAAEGTAAVRDAMGIFTTVLLQFLRAAVDDLGQTVVMVTHDPGAAAYADRVVFLVDGAIVEELAHPTRERVLEIMGRLGG